MENANLSILKKFSCDIEKFTLIYGLFPSDAFAIKYKIRNNNKSSNSISF